MNVDNLIDQLARDVREAPPLPTPSKRVGLWILASAPVIALLVLIMSPRPDLAAKLAEPRFLIEQGAALVTALLAAYGALCLGVPGHSRMAALLPLAPLAVWLASLGEGCLSAWLAFGEDGLKLTTDWICVPAIAMTGLVPGAVIAIMMRRGAPLAPKMTLALGALASGALANVGLRLFHVQDASLMVLVWQFGTVVAVTGLGGLIGNRFLSWPKLASFH